MKKVMVLYSGGVDSTVLLHHLMDKGYEVEAVTFRYGQRHYCELQYAAAYCDKLGVAHDWVYLPRICGSTLTGDGTVPHGHYEDESMRSTVVPNRNMIMIAHAASLAMQRGCETVAIGCHDGDRAIYPDCSDEFVKGMDMVLRTCGAHRILLIAPFLTLRKVDIVRKGVDLGVDFSKTWTCYEGKSKPCGKCGACVERNEAMKENGL